MTPTRAIGIAVFALVSALTASVLRDRGEAAAVPSGAEPSAQPAAKPAAVESQAPCFFADFKNRSWVEGRGVVKKVLPDDTQPPCHQRILLADPAGRTILIAHNIDGWARLEGVERGDEIAFRGEFVDNERGGVVHWTHPDPAHRKPGGGGWLRKLPAGGR